jgi:hypothetical protein
VAGKLVARQLSLRQTRVAALLAHLHVAVVVRVSQVVDEVSWQLGPEPALEADLGGPEVDPDHVLAQLDHVRAELAAPRAGKLFSPHPLVLTAVVAANFLLFVALVAKRSRQKLKMMFLLFRARLEKVSGQLAI